MKINFTAICHVPAETLERNEANAMRLGFPRLGKAGADSLAVVGGGPSILDNIEWLRAFPGDIWAVNGAYRWCVGQGIDAAFCSMDPASTLTELCEGAKRAILALHCDPAVFASLKDADLTVVKLAEGHFETGPSTATAVPLIAVRMGYREVTFLGCESSDGTKSHAYESRTRRSILRVECGGEAYLVCPEMFMQAQWLSQIIRAAPNVFKERSGGLLGAMVNNPDHDITGASRSIYESLKAA